MDIPQDSPVKKRIHRRPAETASAAGAIGLLLAYTLGVRDSGVITALGITLGLIPAMITWCVDRVRHKP